MSVEIRCVSYSEDTRAAIDQMDAVFGPTFVRLFGDGIVSASFRDLVIFTSIMHPAAHLPADNRRGSYHKPTDTYCTSCRLDYADWVTPDWPLRVLGYGRAVTTAIMRIAKTRLTETERAALLDANERAISELLALPPDSVAPLLPICLVYYDSDRPGIHFGPAPGANDFSPAGFKYVEVKPEDAFSAAAQMPEREDSLPSIPRLFRRDQSGLHFYEAFPHNGQIAEHEGRCGIGGDNRFHDYKTPGEAAKIVTRLKSEAKTRGFRAIPHSRQKRLIVEYPVTANFADASEVDVRHALEDFLDDWTGRLGLGHCDGGSSGQGTMEVCCFVVDFDLAKTALEPVLADSDFKAYNRIYLET